MDNEVEIWKSHPEYTEIEVSSFGRIRSLKGHCYNSHPTNRGYLNVRIPINGKWAAKLVHRLVAQTFITNPNNLPQVNHKDCNRKNNNVKNLEWCTASYNQKYREKHGVSQTEVQGHPVLALSLTTLKVSHFRSQREAGRLLDIRQSSINAVIKGRIKQNGGYWFVNADDNAVDLTKQKLRDIGKTKLTAADKVSAEFVSQVLAGCKTPSEMLSLPH